jgi:integrase
LSNKINFTKAALDAIPTPSVGQRTNFIDAKTTGLQLRVTSQGVKTFCVRRRTKGGDVERITLGHYPDMSIEQARKLSARVNAEIEEGANPAAVKRAHKAEPSLGDLFEMYMKAHGDLRKRPDKMRDLFRLYLTPLANKKASQITYQMVERWHKELPAAINRRREQERQRIDEVLAKKGRVGRGVKSTPVSGMRTANTALALLHAVYEKARNKRWWSGENPAHGVDRFKETSRDRFLQTDELPRFFHALSEEPNETIRDYFLIALLTGARRSNTLAMRWDEISFERREWRIPMTKNGTPQIVTLTSESLAILESRKDNDSEWVFPARSRTGHLMEPKLGWDRILTRAGIQDLRIHDLRRTLGSWQAKTGASLAIIGKSLNHKSIQTTTIYARLDLDPVRESVERATSAMLTAAGLKKPENDRQAK